MAGDSTQRKAFKDYFDRAAARTLAQQMAAATHGFDTDGFVRRASSGLGRLEFAARVQQFADALAATLPPPPKALKIITASLPAPLSDTEAVTDGWLQWPLGQFIADHGLEYFEESMDAMVELTRRFSSEFAVRPFLEQRPDETFSRLLALTEHPDPHVRRWCSEGTRPRLRWAKKLRRLVEDPTPIWPILEALKDDPEPYVRRSVANNLNDIAKDHPELVVRRCREWSDGGGEPRSWVIKHALRSLVKAGDPAALALQGFGPPRHLAARLSVRPRTVRIGQAVDLAAVLETTASRAQDLVVDYVVHYQRKGGKLSAKVFKWTSTRLAAGGRAELSKRHPMRRTTIRALYPGPHDVELQVNGKRVAKASFRLADG